MRFLSVPDYIDSEIFMDHNYGNLYISGDMLKASIRNIDGKTVLKRDYTAEELAFDQKNFVLSKMCMARASKQLGFRLVIDKFGQIIMDQDIDTFIRTVIVLPLLVSLLGAIALKFASFVLGIG